MNTCQRKRVAAVAASALLLLVGACGPAGREAAAQRVEHRAPTGVGASAGSASNDSRAMGASAGEKVDDAAITAQVRAAIAADQELSAIKPDVDTQDGVVTLSGLTPTATAKEHASEVARTIKGVSSVNNQLTIKAG